MKKFFFMPLIITVSLLLSCRHNGAFDPITEIPSYTEPTPETYSITVTQSAGGTVTVSPAKDTYQKNETVHLNAVPDSTCKLQAWNQATGERALSWDLKVTKNENISAVFVKRAWTFLLYMAADNDLESAAIQDLNEIEAADIDGKPIDILALLDRGPGQDSTNGDWTDTRLYHVCADPGGLNSMIVSPRLACPKLGITDSGNAELNMGDPMVLDFLLSSVKESFPAENYCLIFWGHGTGWRSSAASITNALPPLKAMAFDDTSKDYMTITEAAHAMKDKGLNVTCFDTCFGALLEIAYEMRLPVSRYLVGSAGAVPSAGWNYTDLFDTFVRTDLSASSFGETAIAQFRDQYEGIPGSTISLIDLSKTLQLRNDFENFARTVADAVTTASARARIRSLVLKECDLYRANTFPCDTFIDASSLAEKIRDNRNLISASLAVQTSILDSSNALSASVSAAVLSCWSQEAEGKKRIGVNLIGFIAPSIPQSSHDPSYVRGSGATDQSDFVRTSFGWVPTHDAEGSFLDKIFYFENF